MTRFVGTELPDELYKHLVVESIRSNTGKAILIATTDENNWPHIAMLSHWELVAMNRYRIRVGTYPSSKTTENLRRRGKITIIIVDRDMTYYVKGIAKEVHKQRSESPVAIFDISLEQVLEDKLPGAPITSGITYAETKPVEQHGRVLAEITDAPT